jgi:hypothetical protein
MRERLFRLLQNYVYFSKGAKGAFLANF